MHKEQLEDLIVEMNTHGPKIFEKVPPAKQAKTVTVSDMALIDEMSGLTDYLDNFMLQTNMPET